MKPVELVTGFKANAIEAVEGPAVALLLDEAALVDDVIGILLAPGLLAILCIIGLWVKDSER